MRPRYSSTEAGSVTIRTSRINLGSPDSKICLGPIQFGKGIEIISVNAGGGDVSADHILGEIHADGFIGRRLHFKLPHLVDLLGAEIIRLGLGFHRLDAGIFGGRVGRLRLLAWIVSSMVATSSLPGSMILASSAALRARPNCLWSNAQHDSQPALHITRAQLAHAILEFLVDILVVIDAQDVRDRRWL